MPTGPLARAVHGNMTQLAINLTEAVLAWRKKRQTPEDPATTAEFTATCQQFLKVLPLVLGFLLGALAGRPPMYKLAWGALSLPCCSSRA
jgi:hypothetical protein